MTGWELLPRIVLLLAGGAAAGMLLRRLGQSVIVGYLLAGVLLGPTGVGLVRTADDVRVLAELGVALLLFSIGLEFSLTRLRELGRVAILGGTIQIAVTASLCAGGAIIAGVPRHAAIAIGLAFAMSSTAVVLRALTDRAELDSAHGRNAIGILLLQDLAVVPVLITVDGLGKSTTADIAIRELLFRSALVIGFALGAWLLARSFLPRVMTGAALSGSRDLPVIVAVCITFGAAWIAHALGFSPALGAFIAGIVLAESPFATQVRADLTPLTAAFVALFFASVGTIAEVPLEPAYLARLFGLVGVLMLGKAAIVGAIVWFFQRSLRTAIATGLCLAQAGEFTFVVAESAFRNGIIPAPTFQIMVAISLITLVLTPYAVAAGPGVAIRIVRRIPSRKRILFETPRVAEAQRRVIVVGFGPAGQEVVRGLSKRRIPFLVLEMNPSTVAQYRSVIPIEIGDATQREVLQHAGLLHSLALVVTVPDPTAARLALAIASRLAPNVPIIARARYHQYAGSLREAGAGLIVDEEYLVGMRLAEEAVAKATAAVAALEAVDAPSRAAEENPS